MKYVFKAGAATWGLTERVEYDSETNKVTLFDISGNAIEGKLFSRDICFQNVAEGAWVLAETVLSPTPTPDTVWLIVENRTGKKLDITFSESVARRLLLGYLPGEAKIVKASAVIS